MTSLGQLVEFIAKSLVDDPSQVHVSEIEGGTSVILELRVGPEDMGRVIGRGGRTANAMRATGSGSLTSTGIKYSWVAKR